MSLNCGAGVFESEICVTHKSDFCCGTTETFQYAPGYYYDHNTPLRKVPGSLGVYQPWVPGQDLGAIAKCELDLTLSTETCPGLMCTGSCDGNLIDPNAVNWPAGTTRDDIEQVRCDASCCLKFAQMMGCC
jgi:hypothetical protein